MFYLFAKSCRAYLFLYAKPQASNLPGPVLTAKELPSHPLAPFCYGQLPFGVPVLRQKKMLMEISLKSCLCNF